MTDDIKIIKQLEKHTGRGLRERAVNEIMGFKRNGFSIDEKGQVTGLNLDWIKLTSPALSTLSTLHHLEKLCLRDTKITDISYFQGLSNLTVLNLWKNQITDISSLQGLRNLTSLFLKNNQITDISSLQKLSQIKYLNLVYNKIRQLPESILELGLEIDVDSKSAFISEEKIFLLGNPLEKPPIEIIRQGKEAIRAYFKSLAGEKQNLNEVKVLMVGDGGAGKTSLVKRFLNQGFDKNEDQTHGINIRHCKVKSGKVDIIAHTWDFGGQEIMHASHQFFLSERSLYILVLDGRKDHKVEYWLKHIESFGGNSPVLIVINKIDENPGFDLDRNTLLQKYENIVGFYRTSCKTGAGIDEFKKALEQAIPRTVLLQTPVAVSWLKVKEKLENATARRNYISHQEFETICRDENISDDNSRTTLIRFLNQLGVVLHFRQLELKDFHVLNPRWVTEAVYKIINSPFLAENKGILDKEKVDYILNKEKIKTPDYRRSLGDIPYNTREQAYIVNLMEKFELCYTLANHRILVPDLLDKQAPDSHLEDLNALKFIYQYDFLPRSVMPRLIINLHPDIKDDCRWRTGMVLENSDNQTTALVKADEVDKTIFIHITGQGKREYLSIIRHALNEINRSFERLEYKELIPLPIPGHIIEKYEDRKDVPGKYRETVAYSNLLGHERSGRDEYFDGETGLSYSVSQLLDSVVKPEERKKEGRDTIEKDPPASDRKLTDIRQLSKKIERLKIDLQKEAKLKELCDGEAEKKARRFTWRFASLNIFILIAWAVLIFLVGWEIIEKWTYLAGLLALVIHAVIFALTGNAYNSREAKTRRLEKEKKKQYTVHRFSMNEYERLNRELENAQSLHQQLLE